MRGCLCAHVKLFVTLASVVAAKAHGSTLGAIGCAHRVLRQGADTHTHTIAAGAALGCNNGIGFCCTLAGSLPPRCGACRRCRRAAHSSTVLSAELPAPRRAAHSSSLLCAELQALWRAAHSSSLLCVQALGRAARSSSLICAHALEAGGQSSSARCAGRQALWRTAHVSSYFALKR